MTSFVVLLKNLNDWARMYRKDRTLDSLWSTRNAAYRLLNLLDDELVSHPDYEVPEKLYENVQRH